MILSTLLVLLKNCWGIKMSSNKNSYTKAALFYIIANCIGQGFALLSNIIFTRIMSKEYYGLYTNYYSIVSLLTPFVGANLFIGLNTGYFDFKDNRKQFRASIAFLSLIVFLGFSACAVLLFAVLKCFNVVDFSFLVIMAALIHAYSFFVVNFYSNFENMENHFKVKSLLMILPNLLQILFSILLILCLKNNSYYERVLGSVSGVFVCALPLLVIMFFRSGSVIRPDYYKYALKISVPSILSSIAYMIMQQSDHVMITHFVGAEATAVYGLVYLIGNILYAFLQATSGAFQSWLYHALDSSRGENIKKIQKWYLFFFLFLAYGLMMVAPELVKILAPETYWDFRYIPPFVAGSSLMVLVNMESSVGEFHKKTGRISLCVALAAIINIVLNYIFIRKIGAIAASYTSLFSYLVLSIILFAVINKLHKHIYSIKYMILYFIAIIIGCAIFFAVGNNIALRYVVFILILGLLLFFIFRKKDEVMAIVRGGK